MNGLRGLRTLPATLGRPVSASYVPELDGLRFVALVLVMVWHASIRATRYSQSHGMDDGLYAFVPHGEVGVLLFFCISGYVVSQPFLGRPREAWQVGSFYLRRFVRIYPPYFIALSGCFFVLQVVGHVPAQARSYDGHAIPLAHSYLASLVYLHGFVFNAPSRLNPPIWSLEIEILFYAAVPVLMHFLTKIGSRSIRMASLAAAIAALVCFTAAASSRFGIGESFRWGPVVHGHLFLLGVLAADATAGLPARPRTKRPAFDLFFVAGSAGLLGIGLRMTRVDADLPGGWLTLLLELSVIGCLALVFVGALFGRYASRCLSLPWIRLTGTMCYSIYLTHIVTMQAASEIMGRVLHLSDPGVVWAVWLGVLVPAGLVVGFVFYVFVERPFASAAQAPRPAASTAPGN